MESTEQPPREWLSVKEACNYARVSKPKLYQMINDGLIKSASLKKRGQIRGTRLIFFDSLRAFLMSLLPEDKPANPA